MNKLGKLLVDQTLINLEVYDECMKRSYW